MLGQITYPSKSTGDVVDNLVGNTAAAKALPLSAYQGYVLDTKIAAINNNFGNIQVASLTVTTQEASAAGQPVTIANSAYTITANFDSALSVTVPIYTWGEYTAACEAMSEDIAISPDKFQYIIELSPRVYLYKDGDECTRITGGWTTAYKHSIASCSNKADGYQIDVYPDAYDLTLRTAGRIDMTPYSLLCIEIEQMTEYAESFFAVISGNTSLHDYPPGSQNTALILEKTVCVSINNASKINTVHARTLDISGITGAYYIAADAYSSGKKSSIKIKNVWLIKRKEEERKGYIKKASI